MSWAFVQKEQAYVVTQTSCAKAFDSDNTAGNQIIVAIFQWNSGGVSGTIGVSDSQGNTYAQEGTTVSSGSGGHGLVFRAKNIKAGPNTVTVAVANASDVDLAIHEYSGLDNSAANDGIAENAGGVTGGTALNSGNLTTTVPDLLFSMACDVTGNNTFTPTSGFTLRENVANSDQLGMASFDADASTTTTYANAVTFATTSSGGIVWLGAFKVGSGPPPPPSSAAPVVVIMQ